MADSGDRTEEATPKKLRDARKKGQLWRSRDLTSAFILVIASFALSWHGPTMAEQLRMFMVSIFTSASSAHPPSPNRVLEAGLSTVSTCLWPVLVTVMAVAVLVNLVQVRPLFTLEPLKPQLKKMDPIAGLKRIFGGRGFFDAAIAVAKVIVVFSVVAWTAMGELSSLVCLPFVSPQAAASGVVALAGTIMVRGAFVLLGLAVLDVFYQRYRFRKDMRMSKREVQREFKESEGDQSQKGERRRLHGELVEQAMLEQVRKADVVIVNPTHLAVALSYDTEAEEDAAPLVVASGKNILAQKIIEVARHSGVPVMRNVELARSLSEVEVGDQIPEELYEAVAEILRIVMEHNLKDQK